jgi:hypothetical protein
MTRFIEAMAVLCAVACAAACGDSSNNVVGADLAASAADLAVSGPPKDMAGATCAATAACIMACDPASLNVCVPGCISALSAAAMPYFNTLELCSQPACYAVKDGGAPPCSQPASTACSTCLSTSCGSQLSACLAH